MTFSGKRVLLVEDEPIIAMSVEDILAELGCVVVGPALSAAAGEELARNEQFDAALLDINMGDGASFPIAEILRQRNIPFGFATGYGRTGVPADLRRVPVLAKPYTKESLAETLRTLLASECA
jgi:CheY-like chemotaxis protein